MAARSPRPVHLRRTRPDLRVRRWATTRSGAKWWVRATAPAFVTLTPVPDAPSPGPRRLAAALTGLQAVALGGFAAFYVYELMIGEGSDTARVLMSAVLILVGSGCLWALTRGWLGGADWPRTPTIVWGTLLVPVGFGLVQGNQTLAGWGVLVLAAATVGAALKVPATPEDGGPGVDPGD